MSKVEKSHNPEFFQQPARVQIQFDVPHQYSLRPPLLSTAYDWIEIGSRTICVTNQPGK
jgi:hypothetical protein